MTKVNGYNDYPTHVPPKDDYYLVSVKHPLILKIGLSPSPDVLIARYNQANREWTTVFGSSGVGLGNIASDVLAWRELPKP